MAITKRGAHVRTVWRKWWESEEEKDVTVGEFWDKMAEAGILLEERAVIEAARRLYHGYVGEDMTPDWWKTDDQIDHRLYTLFLKIEALEAT